MGLGEFFALASALCWAVAVIMLRRFATHMPALELNLFKNSLSLLLVLVTIALWQGIDLPYYENHELLIVFMSGFLGIAIADTVYFQALRIMGASRTGIVSTLYTPFVLVLSAVFLSESLVFQQWLGFLLVSAGIVFVSVQRARSEVSASEIRKGSLLAMAAMASMAVGIVMVKEILEERSFLWTMELRILGGWVGMILIVTVRSQWRRVITTYRQPHRWSMIILASILAGYLGFIFWLAGYKMLPASVAAILNETNNAFIVLLAWWVLGEPVNSRKLMGLGLTLLGVMLMLSG